MKNIEKHPVIILLVLFILAGLAYGPIKNGDFKLNFSNNAVPPSSAAQTLERATPGNVEIACEIKNAEQNANTLQQNINQTTAAAKRSPYYGKISMSSVYGLYQDNPD